MSQAQIGNLQIALGINTAQFAAGVQSARSSLATLGNSIKAFAAGTSAVALFGQSIEALHQVADLGDVAESIGITAEQLQVFQRMALASGTSTDVLVRGLQSIAEQSVDAKSKLSKLFAANDLTAAGKSMNEIILTFMELLRNARTPAEQLAMATGVLGDKVGRQLVEALRAGSSGWQEEFANMKQSGNYLADSAVADAQRIETAYNQMTANIATAWQRMVVTVVTGADNMVKALDPILNPDMSKGSAGGELWKYLTGQKVNWNFGASAGFGDKIKMPPTVNMGPMGGPGEFITVPVKPSLLPVDPPQKEKLAKDIQKTVSDATYIPPDTIDSIYGAGEAFQTLWDEMEQGIAETNSLDSAFQSMAMSISDSLGNAIEGLISGTMSLKDAFRSMTQSLAQQLSQLAAQIIQSQIFRLISMLAGGMGGFTLGGMSFGGFYADGGTLGSGKWGIAGEAGPELVKGPASITPMDKLGGQAPQMNVTVINNSAASVNTRKTGNGDLEVMVEDMIAEKLIRGGNKIDAALARGYGLRRAGRS